MTAPSSQASTERAADFVQRRRLRRRLSLWRVLAIAALGLALIALIGRFDTGASGDHIAYLPVGGLITSDQDRDLMLAEIAEDESVAALVLDIDSPGGTTAGSEALYLAIRQVAEVKPVVAMVSNTAASGAYIAAMGADHIVARGNAIVGSVGVIFQWPEIDGLLDTVGVELRQVKSSPLKAEPDFTGPTPPAALANLEAMVRDTQNWFTGLVRTRRAIPEGRFATVTSGRVFTGRQALDLGLIDAVGGEDEVLAWLEGRGVSDELDPVVYTPDDSLRDLPWLRSAALHALDALGLDAFGLATTLSRAVSQEAASLNGLLALWHPSRHAL